MNGSALTWGGAQIDAIEIEKCPPDREISAGVDRSPRIIPGWITAGGIVLQEAVEDDKIASSAVDRAAAAGHTAVFHRHIG